MAVLKVAEEQGSAGVRKRIDSAAMMMLIDGQQAKQYKEPEKSAIREVVSNAIDAISEKQKALKILSGTATPDEFYVRRMDAVMKDSNFFPDYYDASFLSPSENRVLITHKYNAAGKDVLKIKDWGVGIGFVKHPDTGKTRLEGVLEIGYSTKRNTNTELGKWGIGAKSPLAIGSETGYLMETNHNGKRFLIRVFDYNYHSMIGKMNSKGQENPFVLFYEGTTDETPIYYEETTHMNSTEITIEVSPAQRNLFKKAVLDQLQYFDNIDFHIIEEDGQVVGQPVAVKKLYDGKTFIIPERSDYTHPHLILNRVNYGLINYGAMEVEQRKGCLALKIDPSLVEVDRSRESLIWNSHTRDAVTKFHKEVEREAAEVLYKSLDIENYVEWYEAILSFRTNRHEKVTGKGSVVAVLSAFLEGYQADVGGFEHKRGGAFPPKLFSAGFQLVQTSTVKPSLTKGNETKKLEELGVSLQYSNAEEYAPKGSDLLEGTPVVIRVIRGDNLSSISGGEKFSILKYLRDELQDPNLGKYYIKTFIEGSEMEILFRERHTANLKNLRFFDFDKAANAYKINIDSGEVTLTSDQERKKREQEERKREQAKLKRTNKTFNAIITLPSTSGALAADQRGKEVNAESLLNRHVDGKKFYWGRVFTRDYDYDEDDNKFMWLISSLANVDSEIICAGTTISSMNWFPTDAGVFIRNYFTTINENKKFDFSEISDFLICLAYAPELSEFLTKFIPLRTYMWSKELNDLYVKLLETFPKLEYMAPHLKGTFGKSTYNNLFNNALKHFKSNDEDFFQDWFIKIAKFGRFCYENSTASEDFLANAYVSIMEMPEDTPLDNVPIGIEGFNQSPVSQIKDMLNMLSPIETLLPAISSLNGDFEDLELVFIEAFNNFGFTHHNLKS